MAYRGPKIASRISSRRIPVFYLSVAYTVATDTRARAAMWAIVVASIPRRENRSLAAARIRRRVASARSARCRDVYRRFDRAGIFGIVKYN
jgi:hypothetical protein